MGFLRILIEGIVRFVQMCATAIGTVISGLSGRPSIPIGQGVRQLRGGKRNLVITVCVLAIVVSLARLLMTTVGSSRKVDIGTYEVLGTVCAEETSKLLRGDGQVVVITWDTSHHKMPSVEAEVGSFRKGLGKAGRVSIRATESLGYSRPPVVMERLTTERLMAIIKRYPGVDAIVSFVGIPALSGEEIKQWPRTAPKLVMVGFHDPGTKLKELLDARVVQLAILPRPASAPNQSKKPETDRERFDQSFQIVTSPPPPKSP